MKNLKKLFIVFVICSLSFILSFEKLDEAKVLLKKGVDNWDVSSMNKARDLLISLILTEKENPYIYYYIGLTDYRLATFFLEKEKKKAERYLQEGLDYLDKAIKINPAIGELYALYGSLLGTKIGLKPEEAMFIGMEIDRYFSTALEKDPENPRVNLLKGIDLLYTPEQFGGGAKNALKYLERSISLFEKKKIEDPLKPSWGKEEAYTYLGMAWQRMNEKEKAYEALKKALEINPSFGYARIQLNQLEKSKKEPK